MAYATVNPFTGEQVKTFPNASDQEIQQALDAAQEAFNGWKTTTFTHRSQILQKAADLLRAEKPDLAGLLTLEMGKLFNEAQDEVEICAEIFEYYARHAETLLQPEKLPASDEQGEYWLKHEPLGVLLAVEPWNFPYYQVARIIAPQLAAGNTILLKHASIVPQSAAAFEQLMREAGLPSGAFQNLYASKDQVETIIHDPRVQGVALTGSEGAGAAVAEQAGKALKKTTLELGGADPFVVLRDADLDKTIQWAVMGRHFNGGQVCTASKRMIIDQHLYDDFLQRYTEAVAQLKAGDPMLAETTLAPLSSQEAADNLKAMIDEAVQHGATATPVGPAVPTQGAFVQPTILTDVTPDNPAYYKEFFGPVSMLIRAEDEQEAIRIANDSHYGLGGSVFTQDIERGQQVADQISTGMIFINHPTVIKPDLPFGGVRRSGYGRELIGLGIKEFVNHKLVGVVDIDAPF